MADLELTADEAALGPLLGVEIFRQGRALVDAGRVTGARWHEVGGRAFGQVNTDRGPATAMVIVTSDSQTTALSPRTHCTCGQSRCAHAAAVLISALEAANKPAAPTPTPPRPGRTEPAAPVFAAWEHTLGALLPKNQPGRKAPGAPDGGMGLQFDLTTEAGRSYGSIRNRIGLRPVIRGAKNNWIRSGISWATVGHVHHGQAVVSARQGQLLREILALYSAAGAHHQYGGSFPHLEDAPSRRIWDLLEEAQELGMTLVQSGKAGSPVTVISEPARAGLTVHRVSTGLKVLPQIEAGGEQIDLRSALLLGNPPHGVAWWDGTTEQNLRLAPLERSFNQRFGDLIGSGSVEIPSSDEERFLRDFLPELSEGITVTTPDLSVALPEVLPPVLVLTAERLSEHRLQLEWRWKYQIGEDARFEPLWAAPREAQLRDLSAELPIVQAVTAAAMQVGSPALFELSGSGRRLAPAARIGGLATVQFLTLLLPVLAGIEGVIVLMDDGDDAPDYREADDDPVIEFGGDRDRDDRDWFSLAVTVSVDGEIVPFNELFVALVGQQEHLILASGTYFSLDHPGLHRLATLIAEARALQDVESQGIRLSRFQAGLWEELEQIGVVSGQAAQWQESVRALTSATVRVEHPTPTGLDATLRPYQLAGFNWLAALYEYQLGGILADDMGLGKTVQALALFAHVREQALSDRPFLVIAPTSVVFNWATEAERFTPGLKVAAIGETRARRGDSLESAIAGADIVVTSYTLFRLEYEAYAEVAWGGMILDEAQFVKNHQSQSYQCVKKLPAPFKLAITGTPMENNLMELWSLLSITAPGLFASPAKFTEFYRTPIEKNQDTPLLEQLRRRIRPLMLRRTKEAVASDLPDKLEQTIELELHPDHRKVYERHLHRERQKVLGLLDDLQKNRFEIFRSLTLLRQASLDVALIDPKYAGVPSTKLNAMMEQVEDIAGEGHRTLIFSQFTRFLGAARDRLEKAGIEYCYLDGSTRNRAAVLKEFKTGTAPVFLISLKAGGFGLNLTEADYCILLDPWWNPATEAQAVDRVHRIGQTKKVMVYRLVAKDTIEEKVMALKAGKSALFSSVMDGGGFESGAMNAEDIRGLLD